MLSCLAEPIKGYLNSLNPCQEHNIITFVFYYYSYLEDLHISTQIILKV